MSEPNPSIPGSSNATTNPRGSVPPASRPLHILHLVSGSDTGGLSCYLLDLCSALQSAGHAVTLAGQAGAWHERFITAGLHWIDIPLKGGPLAMRAGLRLLNQQLSPNRPDVIHTHTRRGTFMGRRLQSGWRGPTGNIPLLYTVHLSHLRTPWTRLLADFGDHTHVASSDASRWLVEDVGMLPDHITVIPHGIDTDRFPLVDADTRAAARAALGLSPADRVAVYVGRMENPKNEVWMLDVAAASRQALPDLRMLLVGEGPNESHLRRHIEQRGLGDRVRLLGHRDPLPIYQAADAVLLASLREGFSLVSAEAMSVGIPVLRTRTSGTHELIIENVTGRSVAIDHDAFVSGAIDFLSDRQKLATMGQAAARHIREHFTFERQFSRTMELYHHLIDARAARA